MKLTYILPIISLTFCNTALACRYKAQTIEERFENSEHVFVGVITGITLIDYEESIKDQIDKDPEGFKEIITIPEDVEFRLFPAKSIKGKDIPRQVIASGCGSGQAELRDRVLVFASEYEGKWYGYFISHKLAESYFEEAKASVKELADDLR